MQLADIDVGKAGETAEDISVAYELQFGFVQRYVHDFEQLLLGEVVADNGFAVQFVVDEQVALDVSMAAGQHQNVFQCRHIDPCRIGPEGRFFSDPCVEAHEETTVEFTECQILALVALADESGQMRIDTPIFIIGTSGT